MSEEARRLSLAIHGEDVWFFGYSPDALVDVQGWGSDDPIFAELVRRTRPSAVLEVGTWKGASAITICDQLVQAGLPETPVVCVDTWLGSREMIGVPSSNENRGLHRRNGYPEIYRTFLRNIHSRGHETRIVPFPQTSRAALRWLRERVERFDLVYLDSSHDEADVFDDCTGAWPLLRGPGAVMFGDDFDPLHWPGVIQAVERWSAQAGVTIEIRGRFWIATHP
jgi:hypothetical protein